MKQITLGVRLKARRQVCGSSQWLIDIAPSAAIRRAPRSANHWNFRDRRIKCRTAECSLTAFARFSAEM
jgi:hypothetical protein